MSWDKIIGQDHAVEILRQSIRIERISSAYLFFGPKGVGKSTTAKVMAKSVNCPYQGCDSCPVCIRINEKNYPDVKEISADGSFIKIGQIREINKEVSLSVFEAKYRVYILKEVEKMKAEAANAFLKMLEEPSKNTIFILTTNAIDSLFSTIVSRCQLIRFNLLSLQNEEKVLKEKGMGPEEAYFLTNVSAGRPGKAMEYKEKEAGKYLSMIQGYMEEILIRKNKIKIFDFAEEVKKNSDNIEIILDIIIWMLPNFFSSKNYERKVDNLEAYLAKARNEVLKVKSQLAKNINLQLGIEIMFFRLLD
jgi:DNA polymerase-3 subunit delta'